MHDEFLKRYRRAPRPEFADRLYERIAGPMHTQSPRRAGRLAWLTGATMLASLGFALLLFPPARVFADGIWHQIGAYVLMQTPPDPADKAQMKQEEIKAAAAGQPLPDDATKQAALSAPAPTKVPAASTAAEASQQAGFAVLAPSYVPAGYAQDDGYRVAHESEGVTVMTVLVGTEHNGLKLLEFKLADGHAPVPLYWPDAQALTVRGQPAFMMPGETGSTLSLVWEENGITITLIGEGLTQAEFIKVAEGLR
jgi:hypothetical protein